VPGTDQKKFSVQVYGWSVPGTLTVVSPNSGFHSDLSIAPIDTQLSLYPTATGTNFSEPSDDTRFVALFQQAGRSSPQNLSQLIDHHAE